MSRLVVFISVLTLGLLGSLVADRPTPGVLAQDATPPTAGHSLVGSWVVEEILRPQNVIPGSPTPDSVPQAVAVASFFADGNALITGYGGDQISLQGAWSDAGENTGRFSVVGLTVGGDGFTHGGLERVSATVALDATGDRFAGDYTFELIEPDGRVSFTWFGSWSGTRVEVQPSASSPSTPASGTPTAWVLPTGRAAIDRTAFRYFIPLGG